MSHYTAVIIKPKTLDVDQARQMFGDVLVSHEVADYYSTGSCNEQFFDNGKREISLDAYAKSVEQDYENDNLSLRDYCFIDDSVFISKKVIVPEFWDICDPSFPLAKSMREDLLSSYGELYRYDLNEFVKSIKDKKKFSVVLLDYHN